MRLSRPNYDKVRRCPGWSGGGLTPSPEVSRCDDGHICQNNPQDANWPKWRWKFGRCDTCDVVTLPSHVRWIDPSWLRWKIPTAIRWWWYDRTHGR